MGHKRAVREKGAGNRAHANWYGIVGDAGRRRIRTSSTPGSEVSDGDMFKMVKDLKEGIETIRKECNPVQGGMKGRNDALGRVPNRTRMKKVMKIKKATNSQNSKLKSADKRTSRLESGSEDTEHSTETIKTVLKGTWTEWGGVRYHSCKFQRKRTK